MDKDKKLKPKKILKKKEPIILEKEVKKPKKVKELFSVREVAYLLVITCFINSILFFMIYNKERKTEKPVDVPNGTIAEIINTYNYIKQNYYRDIDDSVLINGAIKGMTDALGDNYSQFITEAESDNYNITLQGEYYGVGIQITTLDTGEIYITSIIPNSPASQTDLKAGDIIIKANDKSTEGMTSDELGKMIKEGNETNFKLIIKRNDEEKTINIKREKIILESVTSEIINKNNKKIGYLYMSLFAANTDEQFIAKLNELEKSNVDGIIIDVRGNSGGHLNAVTNIISSFLDSSNVIYQLALKDGTIEKTYSTGDKTKKYPVIVLGDGVSASASELLISALKEKYGATFVGTKTFGKGSVQELQTIESTGEQFKITTKKWLTADGNSIDMVGIKPDYEIQLDDAYFVNPSNDTDNQLQKALELLTKNNI